MQEHSDNSGGFENQIELNPFNRARPGRGINRAPDPNCLRPKGRGIEPEAIQKSVFELVIQPRCGSNTAIDSTCEVCGNMLTTPAALRT